MYERYIKRTLDVAISLVSLIVLSPLLAVIAVELLPVTIIGTRAVMGGVEVTYEVDDDELSELESELNEAEEVAKRDMNND